MIKKTILTLSFISLLYSCENQDFNYKTPSSNVTKKEQRTINRFETAEELQKIINSESSTQQYKIREFSDRKTQKNSLKNSNGLDFAYKNELLYDLIPNENLRNIVNHNGEFIVGDSIYKICTYGTLYAHIKNREELRLIDSSSVANANYIGNRLKKTGNIFLYETFLTKTDSKDVALDKTSTQNRIKKQITADENINISQFPVKSISRFTVVGKLRDKLFGEDKWHYETIYRGERLGAKLYDYNYVIVSATGFAAKVERKKWYGWRQNKTWDNGITVGWEDMVFKVTIPGLDNFIPKKPVRVTKEYSEYHRVDFSKFPFSVGDGGVTVLIPYIMDKNIKVSYADIQHKIYDFLAGTLVSGLNSAKEKANGFILDVPKTNTRYIYIRNTKTTTYRHKFNHHFNKNFHFILYAGNGGSFNYYFKKSFEKSFEMKNFELVSGTAYAYTPNTQGGYTGMIVKKIIK